jgi:hypothetical protein
MSKNFKHVANNFDEDDDGCVNGKYILINILAELGIGSELDLRNLKSSNFDRSYLKHSHSESNKARIEFIKQRKEMQREEQLREELNKLNLEESTKDDEFGKKNKKSSKKKKKGDDSEEEEPNFIKNKNKEVNKNDNKKKTKK